MRHNTEKKREKKNTATFDRARRSKFRSTILLLYRPILDPTRIATELRMHMWIVELTFQLRERRIPANGLSLPITGSIPQDCFAHHLNPVIHFRVTFQDSAHKRKGAVQTPHTCSIYKILSNTKRGKKPKRTREREKKNKLQISSIFIRILQLMSNQNRVTMENRVHPSRADRKNAGMEREMGKGRGF